MAKRRCIKTDFIRSCEAYNELNKIKDLVMSEPEQLYKTLPSCSICDMIGRKSVIQDKTCSSKKSSSKRVSKSDTAFVAYRFCGHPTKVQESVLIQNIGAAHFIWNRMLSDYNLMWRELGQTIPITPADYKDVTGLEWLKDMDSSGLANVQLQLEKARSDFFSGDKGKPRYKKKHSCKDSYTTNCTNHNIRMEGDGILLPKISSPVRLSMHRKIRPGGRLKNVTVTREPDGKWYFSIVFEYPAREAELSPGLQKFFTTGDRDAVSGIGLDMSVPFLYIDSTGHKPSYELNGKEITFIKQYRRLERRIAKEQRRRSHMVKDSNNYNRQCEKIAKLYAKAKHRRNDFLHQMAVRLVRTYDVITIEDLDISAMKKGLNLGRSVSDIGWGRFTEILERLCGDHGKALIRVDRWYPSSKTCHHCGYIKEELDINDRTYICPGCGHIMDRDKNAAINILEEGFRILNDNITSTSIDGYQKPSLISTAA